MLAEMPYHSDALHLLGVLASQTGHADKAIDLIGRAIAINPAIAQYHGNLGESYRRLGQLDAALVSLLGPRIKAGHGGCPHQSGPPLVGQGPGR